jgi:hypothetical protein
VYVHEEQNFLKENTKSQLRLAIRNSEYFALLTDFTTFIEVFFAEGLVGLRDSRHAGGRPLVSLSPLLAGENVFIRKYLLTLSASSFITLYINFAGIRQ